MDHFQHILNNLAQTEGKELVDEFKRIFSSRIPNDIQDLIDAQNNGDFQALKQKAHFLSTTLLTLRFTHGLNICNKLQKEIDQHRETSALKLSHELIDYLNGALNELK